MVHFLQSFTKNRTKFEMGYDAECSNTCRKVRHDLFSYPRVALPTAEARRRRTSR